MVVSQYQSDSEVHCMPKSTVVRVLFSASTILVAAIILGVSLRAGHGRLYSAMMALLLSGGFVVVVMIVARMLFGKNNYLS